jgi:hypothetical protein
MNWVQTTLRKGTKTPKICRDMFIAESRGEFLLCEVKNGKMTNREAISESKAIEIIKENNLVKTGSCFSNCFTYRDWRSANLVRDRLNT